jgi:hypothetical protein
MAIKTFTTGEVLTASDTNTYLANAGLVYVTSTTVGSAVSSVTVSNCFSSTYDNYRITVAGIQPTATDSFRLMIGTGATTDHYGSMLYDRFDGAVAGTLRTNNVGSIYCVLNEGGNKTAQFSCDILSPNIAQPTVMNGGGYGRGYWCQFGGSNTNSTAYTAFTLLIDGAGTMTGGTITVYGYRKA